jgi:rifampicin phosphotransferase
MWEMSQRIHKSPTLTAVFAAHQDGAVFEACAESDEGRAFLAYYQFFLEFYGQRGMADRDIYFKRRWEDPSIDYRSLQAMLKMSDAPDPQIKEHETNECREAFVDKVIAKMQRATLGLFKVELFKVVLAWCVEFVIVRDDGRNFRSLHTLHPLDLYGSRPPPGRVRRL